jgi:hypothetical protein
MTLTNLIWVHEKLRADYEEVSIISGTGAAICTAVAVEQCNSR